jgi:hypothetical protein
MTLLEKISLGVVAILVVFLIHAMASSQKRTGNREEYYSKFVVTATHNGHLFTIYPGSGIIHSPSCNCKNP